MRRKLIPLLSLAFLIFSCGGGGDDDGKFGEEEYLIGQHYQGVQCLQCHSFGGGTVFTDLNAPDNDVNKAAVYHTVRLLFKDGSSFRAPRGAGSGNFQIPSNLKGDFTAVVLDGNGQEVNRSAEFSHGPDRFNCNSCHTAQGSSGAPGRIVNFRLSGGN